MKFQTPYSHAAPYRSLITNFRDLSANEFNFMRIANLEIYKGFDRE